MACLPHVHSNQECHQLIRAYGVFATCEGFYSNQECHQLRKITLMSLVLPVCNVFQPPAGVMK